VTARHHAAFINFRLRLVPFHVSFTGYAGAGGLQG
jgi:hypothetical protein